MKVPDFMILDISYLDRDTLLGLPFLTFKTLVNVKTGEISGAKIAVLYGMKICIFNNEIQLKGSVHQAYSLIRTGHKHNCSDFGHEEFKIVVEMLREEISLDPARTKLKTMEFGVTIDLGTSATQLIEENFFGQDYIHAPEENKHFSKRGRYKKYTRSNYEIKFYDKARHCKSSSHRLRVELRTKKAQYTQRLKIDTLEDLLCPRSMRRLAANLLFRFEQILILDKFRAEATPEHWAELRKGIKAKTFQRFKKSFLVDMEAANQLTIKKELAARLASKFKELIPDGDPLLPLDKG